MDVAPDHQIITVDGEQFCADYDPDQPGAYHCTWLSGRDPNYGFTFRALSHERQPQQLLIDQIRDFLSQIDPATGYLPD